MSKIVAFRWMGDSLNLIDQRILPHEEVYRDVKNIQDTFHAIEVMIVRGAPLIGFTALYGLVLHLKNNKELSLETLRKDCDYLIGARPTAVNLAYEVNRAFDMANTFQQAKGSLVGFVEELESFANQQVELMHTHNLDMAKLATQELERIYGDKKLNVMTLCNTGALACGPMGTALGVIEYLHSLDKINHVYASETRPYLQGGRLTAFELSKMGAPYSISVEGAFSYMMKNKLVDAVFIGADRIVANGDTANKIGSSTLAIVCQHYGVPFYVVAPTSSFDFVTQSGEGIEIEMRNADEVLFCQKQRIAPHGAKALNPSFDITNHEHISGIICEQGFLNAPYIDSIARLEHS